MQKITIELNREELKKIDRIKLRITLMNIKMGKTTELDTNQIIHLAIEQGIDALEKIYNESK